MVLLYDALALIWELDTLEGMDLCNVSLGWSSNGLILVSYVLLLTSNLMV